MKLNWIGIRKVERAKNQKLYALSTWFQDHFGDLKTLKTFIQNIVHMYIKVFRDCMFVDPYVA